MQWRKAGRPSSKPKKEKFESSRQDWTKEELSILSATKESALVVLGIAVVKQWIKDGKPMSDFEGIKFWLQVIKESLLEKNDKQNLPALPENN